MALVIEGRGKDDPLYDEAVGIVRANQNASLVLLQRELLIGYARSAVLLDAMVGTVLVAAGNEASIPRNLIPCDPAT
ncbi:DNA translocase FtsK [Paraburkholderia sp. J8-2]|uniref:DNA translocase FtsK n=1 Tax=Paraburkholderia sp. J8-2 TaxID=2805440 RepID=UPI002AB63C2C|nr:DNA translocase FtsK [Paraburkholderia sp. J8-2]